MTKKLIFATRPSALARWQTNYIIQQLQDSIADLECQEVVITTKGDQVIDQPLPEIGGKGLFTFELEEALQDGQVDAAVHSLKDLPTVEPDGLTIAAIPEREDPHDALVSASGAGLGTLAEGAIVGTGTPNASASTPSPASSRSNSVRASSSVVQVALPYRDWK